MLNPPPSPYHSTLKILHIYYFIFTLTLSPQPDLCLAVALFHHTHHHHLHSLHPQLVDRGQQMRLSSPGKLGQADLE